MRDSEECRVLRARVQELSEENRLLRERASEREFFQEQSNYENDRANALENELLAARAVVEAVREWQRRRDSAHAWTTPVNLDQALTAYDAATKPAGDK